MLLILAGLGSIIQPSFKCGFLSPDHQLVLAGVISEAQEIEEVYKIEMDAFHNTIDELKKKVAETDDDNKRLKIEAREKEKQLKSLNTAFTEERETLQRKITELENENRTAREMRETSHQWRIARLIAAVHGFFWSFYRN
jgi:septal ring factor EnvC (AmiA/AmiB activator)